MTVSDLMAELAQHDPALTVIMPGERGDHSEVHEVITDHAWAPANGPAYLTDPGDPNGRRVVRLCSPPGLTSGHPASANRRRARR